ncbi:hypothetical protein FOA52_010591 [Chlamydomonas sp. UWO 241]|nr:hypothetical protein FOA52_010591 [Chlamydomonas sp. UWO 241]
MSQCNPTVLKQASAPGACGSVFEVLRHPCITPLHNTHHGGRLQVYPEGCEKGKGTHLSVFIQAQDDTWGPSAEYKLTVVNQMDASKSCTHGHTRKFTVNGQAWGYTEFITLPALRNPASGWLLNDTLMLTVEIAVHREGRFQLDTGGMPCDVTLKLACGVKLPVVSEILQLASPFFLCALEDVKGSGPIPVDGSLGVWNYILSDLFPQYDAPTLTLGSVYVLLPVVHKYDFTKLLARLVTFVKEKVEVLSPDLSFPKLNIICWLQLTERLQLDQLRDLCLGRLRSMTRKQVEQAILLPAAPSHAAGMERGVREEVKQLGPELCFKIVAIVMRKCAA